MKRLFPKRLELTKLSTFLWTFFTSKVYTKWGSPCSLKRKRAFITLSCLLWGKSLTFCTRGCSFARTNDEKIVRSKNAQCKTRESPYSSRYFSHRKHTITLSWAQRVKKERKEEIESLCLLLPSITRPYRENRNLQVLTQVLHNTVALNSYLGLFVLYKIFLVYITRHPAPARAALPLPHVFWHDKSLPNPSPAPNYYRGISPKRCKY